jgi:trimethylamine--corrinoid protein Co-methyltransferase
MGYQYRIPPYEILSYSALDRIHNRSLETLANVGVQVPNKRILTIASDNGAKVDWKAQRLRLPPDVTIRMIAQAGKQHVLYGRDRRKTAEFGYDMFNFNGSSGQYRLIDFESRARRRPNAQDLRDAIRIGESLQSINITGSLVVPSDVPPADSDVVSYYELLTATTKPFTSWIYSDHSASTIIEMMGIAAGGAEELKRFPFCEIFVEPVSPLTFRPESLEILNRCVDAGLPVGISPMVQAGATGPCSIAGALVQENAEVLAGIVIVQFLNPGHPAYI